MTRVKLETALRSGPGLDFGRCPRCRQGFWFPLVWGEPGKEYEVECPHCGVLLRVPLAGSWGDLEEVKA